MNSRYGLWIVWVCGISLAGCANWQNRTGSNGPGTAATLQPGGAFGAPAVASASGVAPGTTFNEPPPPMPPPPSDPNAMMAPLGSAPDQKLDLSVAPAGGESPVPDRMYNLESSTRKTASKSSSSSNPSRSSTISKLASKAGTSSGSSKSSGAGLSTVQRLQNASSSSSSESSTVNAAPAPAESEPQAAKVVEPAPKAAPKQQEPSVVDTALLAQPVRKGASSDNDNGGSEKSSKGPQSSVAPARKMFEMNKAVIYPVSNPASESPVDTAQFS